MQTSATTGMTMLIIKELLLPLSAMSSRAPINAMTNPISRSHTVFGEKMTQTHMLYGLEHSYPRNVGSSTTNTRTLNLCDQSLLHSFLLSPTPLSFLHSHSLRQVPALQYSNSTSEEAPGCTCAHKPLQRLFRLYPKPTPYPHSYPPLHLRNPYYAIKSTFDTLTNLMLHRQYKLTFRY